MKLAWLEQGWEDYLSWQTDKRMMKRINNLIRDILRSPFEGIAKPEPLK
ncbi:MAG: YoeB toxin protein, partial [Caulobacter sp.]|nr:YoeB toxin protein [Caulobacter sp.]